MMLHRNMQSQHCSPCTRIAFHSKFFIHVHVLLARYHGTFLSMLDKEVIRRSVVSIESLVHQSDVYMIWLTSLLVGAALQAWWDDAALTSIPLVKGVKRRIVCSFAKYWRSFDWSCSWKTTWSTHHEVSLGCWDRIDILSNIHRFWMRQCRRV